ncbi:hypothetical protein EH5_01722 [Bacillus subtilis]|nr:hypothetical protein EH5_01722 [Bacillus subtilis]
MLLIYSLLNGRRSLKASKILKKQGFKKITNIKGGMNTWY